MAPTFPFFLGFLTWGLVAAAVLTLAGALAIFPRSRRMALRLASAMFATIPGILAYQLVVAPVALAILSAGLLVGRLIEPPTPTHFTSNPIVILLTIVTVFLAAGIGVIASLAGFLCGWRAGWALASGRDLIPGLEGDPLVRMVGFIRSRVGHRGK
jgi:hypothetical protein